MNRKRIPAPTGVSLAERAPSSDRIKIRNPLGALECVATAQSSLTSDAITEDCHDTH